MTQGLTRLYLEEVNEFENLGLGHSVAYEVEVDGVMIKKWRKAVVFVEADNLDYKVDRASETVERLFSSEDVRDRKRAT